MTVRKILGATALIVASQAQAGFVDFTFNGPNTGRLGAVNNNSYTESVGAYSVDIMPYMLTTNGWESLMGNNNGSRTDDMRISRNGGALGVSRPAVASGQPADNNASQIDGSGEIREGLWFDFGNANWSSLTITLRNLHAQDRFDVWMGDSWSPASAASPLEHTAAGIRSGQTYTIANFGHQYLFFAVAEDNNAGTACRSNAIATIETNANCVQIDNIRALPEPASIALLGLGLLAGFGTKPRRLLKEKM